MPNVPYPYEVNGKLVTGNGSLIPICSLSNRSLLPSLTVLPINWFFWPLYDQPNNSKILFLQLANVMISFYLWIQPSTLILTHDDVKWRIMTRKNRNLDLKTKHNIEKWIKTWQGTRQSVFWWWQSDSLDSISKT